MRMAEDLGLSLEATLEQMTLANLDATTAVPEDLTSRMPAEIGEWFHDESRPCVVTAEVCGVTQCFFNATAFRRSFASAGEQCDLIRALPNGGARTRPLEPGRDCGAELDQLLLSTVLDDDTVRVLLGLWFDARCLIDVNRAEGSQLAEVRSERLLNMSAPGEAAHMCHVAIRVVSRECDRDRWDAFCWRQVEKSTPRRSDGDRVHLFDGGVGGEALEVQPMGREAEAGSDPVGGERMAFGGDQVLDLVTFCFADEPWATPAEPSSSPSAIDSESTTQLATEHAM